MEKPPSISERSPADDAFKPDVRTDPSNPPISEYARPEQVANGFHADSRERHLHADVALIASALAV